MIRGKYMTSRDDTSAIMAIRHAVFVGEQGFPAETERDEHDRMAVYALVFDEDDRPVGTGRLCVIDDRFTIGRVCVLQEARARGVGDLVMRMLIYRAQDLSAPSLWVSAQLPAVPFYARYGFRPVGGVHLDEQVEHQWMSVAAGALTLEGESCRGKSCPGDCEACRG